MKQYIFLVLMLLPSAIATISCSETMTRTVPASVTAGQTFTVTYTAVGTSGDYGTSIQEVVSGGCTPADMKFVLTSPATTYTVTMTAPNSDANCVFHGDYKYGTCSIKLFEDQTITIGDCFIGDTDCDGIIQWNEFIAYAQGWLSGIHSWSDFIKVAQKWVTD